MRSGVMRVCVCCTLMMTAIPLAYAHALYVFATANDGVIHGKTYYPSGPAAGIPVTVFGPNDEVLGTMKSGHDGTFTWTPTKNCDLRFVAETPEGHRGEFTIAAAELPGTLPKSETEPPTAASDGSDRSVGAARSSQQAAAEPPADLQQLVEDAVSREIRPLREQIDAAEHRARFRDIVGGIGYIVGVAGLFAFWKSRATRDPR